MLQASKFPYKQTLRIKQGKILPLLIMRRLIEYIHQSYGVVPLNVVYETPHESRVSNPRLTIIFDTPEDENALLNKNGFEINKTKNNTIERKFISLVNDLDLEESYDFRGLFVIYDSFSTAYTAECMTRVWKRRDEILEKSFPDLPVWRTITYYEHMIIFLHNKNQLRKAEETERTDAIREVLFEAYKKYDEFNYITLETFPLHFDTKQNLDERYGGSFRAYFD